MLTPSPKQVIVLDHNIGHDNSGSQLQCLAIGSADRRLIKLLLQPRHPFHRRHRAGKLGEDAVPHGFENAAAMLSNGGFDAVFEDMTNRRKRSALVKLDQPRIAFDIQRDDWHKPAFILGHDGT